MSLYCRLSIVHLQVRPVHCPLSLSGLQKLDARVYFLVALRSPSSVNLCGYPAHLPLPAPHTRASEFLDLQTGFPSEYLQSSVIMGLERVIFLFVCVHYVLPLPQSNSIDFSEDRQTEVDNYARVVQEYCKNRPSNEYFRLTAESNCRQVFKC